MLDVPFSGFRTPSRQGQGQGQEHLRGSAAAQAGPDPDPGGWGCENPKMTNQGFENRVFGPPGSDALGGLGGLKLDAKLIIH